MASGDLMFVGANPGVLLFDDASVPVCFASVWIAEWSPAGNGTAVIVAQPTGWSGFGANRALATYLADTFVRWFPEVSTFPVPDRFAWNETPLDLDLDASRGVTVRGRGISVVIGDPFDMRAFRTPFPLGAEMASLSNVYAPCRSGSIAIASTRIDGEPSVSSMSSSAFMALAEVWVES